MNRFFVMAAAMALVLGGCGKEEEPPKMEQAEAPAMEAPGAPSEEAMMSAPAEGEAMTGEAMGTAQGMADQAGTMADEAATAAEGMAESAESTGQEAAAGAEQAAQEMTAAADQPMATAADRGKQVYDMACFACHADGIAGAPKFGDKALWAPRIAQGMDTLVNHAINGFQGSTGVMPPKGGRMDLSDEDIKAAVSYMVEHSK